MKRTNRLAAVLSLVVLALASAGCSSLQLTTDYNPRTDFSKYRTFTIREGAKSKNPVARRSAEYAVQTALEKQGLKMVDDGADLLIYGHFVLSQDVQFDSFGYGMAGWYGPVYGGPVVTTATVIPVGTLVIDLVDARSKDLVWRGVVKDEISTSLYPEEREKKAIRIAEELFRNFPPKPKKG